MAAAAVWYATYSQIVGHSALVLAGGHERRDAALGELPELTELFCVLLAELHRLFIPQDLMMPRA